MVTIRNYRAGDLEPLCRIYNHYVVETTITFEEIPVTPQDMARRVEAYGQRYPWLVGVDEGQIVGYAYARPWHERSAYRHTAELTIYIDPKHHGRGYGRALYGALLPALAARHCHALIACITLPNPASIRFHTQLGFQQVGHFPQVGWKFGAWVDVGYWQKILENTVD